jgi:hypothetical protein
MKDEPLYDIYRLQSDGILSIFYKGLNSANLYLLNFQQREQPAVAGRALNLLSHF